MSYWPDPALTCLTVKTLPRENAPHLPGSQIEVPRTAAVVFNERTPYFGECDKCSAVRVCWPFVVASVQPQVAWASCSWWPTRSSFPLPEHPQCTRRAPRLQTWKKTHQTSHTQELLVKAEIWQPSPWEGIIWQAGKGIWGMLSLTCRSDAPTCPPLAAQDSVPGDKANGTVYGCTHWTNVWCFLWDNAFWRLLITFSSRQKEAVSTQRTKLAESQLLLSRSALWFQA